MNYFVHDQGLCESTTVGGGTRIWAFAHVLPGARIGADCNICDHVFVENDVVVGDRVTVKCGVQLWDGVRLADDVFVGPKSPLPTTRSRAARPIPRSSRRRWWGPARHWARTRPSCPGSPSDGGRWWAPARWSPRTCRPTRSSSGTRPASSVTWTPTAWRPTPSRRPSGPCPRAGFPG